MTMNEIQNVLNTLMRGIDKKTELTVQPQPTAADPAVLVQLRCGKRTGSVQLSEADLYGAQTDLVRRNRVRTALKRARDRMWDETGYIFSTKFDRQQSSQGDSWFHSSQRGGGRGRR